MSDYLADAKAWIAQNAGDTTEDHGEIEAMLRELVKEVEHWRAVWFWEAAHLTPRAPWPTQTGVVKERDA